MKKTTKKQTKKTVKNIKNSLKLTLLISTLIILLLTFGISYAMFTPVFENAQGRVVTLTSGTLELTLADGENVIGNKTIRPGDTVTKDFSITNSGTIDTTYDLWFSEVMNNFVTKSELVYTLVSNDGGANVTETEVPSDILKAITGQAITAGATHHYTLTIEYKNTDRNQEDNVGKLFGFKLSIKEAKKVSVNTTYYLNNNLVSEMPDNTKSFDSTNSECDHDATITFNENTWTYSISNISSKNTTCRLYFVTAYNTITFNSNGGSVEETSRTVEVGTNFGELPTPTQNGYTFNGWYTEATGGEQVSDLTIMGKGVTVVYAHWNINTYTLTVNPNTGIWDTYTGSQQYQIEYRSTKTINDPEKDGYTFTGWTGLENGTTINDHVLTMGYNHTEITANYSKNSYTLVIQDTYTCDGEFTIEFEGTKALCTPTREGYTFAGWDNITNVSGSTFTQPSHDVTLKATWTPKNYRWIVKHMIMSEDGTSYTEDGDPTTGNGAFGTIFPTTDVRKTFTGFIKPNNGSAYETKTIGVDVEAGTNATPTNNVLEYRYAREQHVLTINLDGGTYTGTNPVNVYYQQTINLATPTKTCHSFAGWNGTTGNTFTGGLSDETITATWTLNTYTVTFNPNGGSVSTPSSPVNCGGTVSLPTPTKAGYDFDGWYTATTGGTEITSSTTFTASQEIFAHWSPAQIPVALSIGGNLVASLPNTSTTTGTRLSYNIKNGVVTATATGTDGYATLNTGATLSTGKTYAFRCNVDGTYGWDDDTVQVYLLLNGGTGTLKIMEDFEYFEFSVTTSGYYKIRIDVNQNGKTHQFQDFSIYEIYQNTSVTYAGTYSNLPTPTKSGYTFKGWTSNYVYSLPSGYYQLDSLEAPEGQGINTGLYANDKYQAELDGSFPTYKENGPIFGDWTSGYSYWIGTGTTNGVQSIGLTLGEDSITNRGVVPYNSDRHLFSYRKDGIYYDNTLIQGNIAYNYPAQHPIYVFAAGAGGGNFAAWYSGYFRLYSLQMKDLNDVLVRKYIPVVNASNVAGLYDLVNGEFYANLGSGTFTTHFTDSSVKVTKTKKHLLNAVWKAN